MTKIPTQFPSLPTGAALAILLAVSPAQAVPEQTSLTQNNTPYGVVSGDLIENFLMGINATGTFDRESIMGFFAMLDGTYGPQGGAGANPGLAAFSAGAGEEIEIFLDTTANPDGYTLNSVNTLAGWDAARASQAYQLEYASTLMPGVWHRIATVFHNPGVNPGFNTNTSVNITDSSSGPLLNNVSALRFTFANTDFWGWNGYREIDVQGLVSTAPTGPKVITGIKVGETYTPSTVDLLQTTGVATVASGVFTDEGVQGIAALNDGVFGNAGGQGSNPPGLGAASASSAEWITFNLDVGAAPYGYSISGIDTYAGWDGYRGGQQFTISYSTVGNPTSFISLTAVSLDTTAVNTPGGNISTSTMVRDADGVLASNVAAVRLDFGDVTFGFAGYREIDIFGTPTAIPEPGTAGLALLGALLTRRRRH